MKTQFLFTIPLLFGLSACPAPKPPTPPATINPACLVSTPSGTPVAGADCGVNGQHGLTDANGYHLFVGIPAGAQQFDVTKDGYVGAHVHFENAANQNIAITLVPTLPAPPTRDELLGCQDTFQGLLVDIPGYGPVPWFEVALSSLTQGAQREAVYAAKHAAGDTCAILATSWNYSGDAGFSYPIPGRDLTSDLPALRALIQDVIQHGFYVRLALAGDGQSADAGYNDPVGWTYGYDRMMAQLPAIAAMITSAPDLQRYVATMPGFDGIITYDERTQQFAPWSLDQLNTYLVTVKQLLPQSASLVEPSTGPLGGTLPEFLSPAARDALDGILNEFGGGADLHADTTWQIADRLLGPAFVRPPDMPASDDADCPPCNWTLRTPTSRGPIVPVAFEYDLYRFVRQQVTPAEIAVERAYLRAMGYRFVG